MLENITCFKSETKIVAYNMKWGLKTKYRLLTKMLKSNFTDGRRNQYYFSILSQSFHENDFRQKDTFSAKNCSWINSWSFFSYFNFYDSLIMPLTQGNTFYSVNFCVCLFFPSGLLSLNILFYFRFQSSFYFRIANIKWSKRKHISWLKHIREDYVYHFLYNCMHVCVCLDINL